MTPTPPDLAAIRKRLALSASVFGALSQDQADLAALLDYAERLRGELARERAAVAAYLREAARYADEIADDIEAVAHTEVEP